MLNFSWDTSVINYVPTKGCSSYTELTVKLQKMDFSYYEMDIFVKPLNVKKHTRYSREYSVNKLTELLTLHKNQA